MTSKQARLNAFIERLSDAPPASSETEAFELIAQVLNQVEDELTQIPYHPQKWMTDGRMYPPQEDSKRSTSNPKVSRYRSRGHNTFIGGNGAIRIQEIRHQKILIDKVGKNNRKVEE